MDANSQRPMHLVFPALAFIRVHSRLQIWFGKCTQAAETFTVCGAEDERRKTRESGFSGRVKPRVGGAGICVVKGRLGAFSPLGGVTHIVQKNKEISLRREKNEHIVGIHAWELLANPVHLSSDHHTGYSGLFRVIPGYSKGAKIFSTGESMCRKEQIEPQFD